MGIPSPPSDRHSRDHQRQLVPACHLVCHLVLVLADFLASNRPGSLLTTATPHSIPLPLRPARVIVMRKSETRLVMEQIDTTPARLLSITNTTQPLRLATLIPPNALGAMEVLTSLPRTPKAARHLDTAPLDHRTAGVQTMATDMEIREK